MGSGVLGLGSTTGTTGKTPAKSTTNTLKKADEGEQDEKAETWRTRWKERGGWQFQLSRRKNQGKRNPPKRKRHNLERMKAGKKGGAWKFQQFELFNCSRVGKSSNS